MKRNEHDFWPMLGAHAHDFGSEMADSDRYSREKYFPFRVLTSFRFADDDNNRSKIC